MRGPSRHDLGSGRLVDAAVDLDGRRRARRGQHLAHTANLFDAVRNERLPAEAQDSPTSRARNRGRGDVFERDGRRGRVQHRARARAELLDEAIVRCRCGTASTWTDTMFAPASTNASM